jgi:MFS family permease
MSLPSPRETFSVSNPRAVWLITGAHAVNEFYSVAIPPVIPLLVSDLGISYAEAGGLLTVYYLVYSAFQLPAGRLADRIGQRGLLAGGMIVLAGGVLLAAVAPDYRTLLAAQALAGVGGSTYHPAGMSLISDLESGGTEGRAMGIHGLGGVAGTALAPALVGGLAALLDWRTALAAGAGVGVVYAVVFTALFAVPGADDEGGGDGGGDGGGTGDGGTGGGTLDGDDGDAVDTDGGTTGGAGAGTSEPDAAADGAGRESRAGASSPTAPAGGLRGRVEGGAARLRAAVEDALNVPLAPWVVVLFVADFLVSFETGAVRTFATSYLTGRVGGTGAANGVFFVMLVGGGVSSLGAGHLADRVNRKAMGTVVLVATGLGLAATAVVPLGALVVYVWFFLLGLVMYAIFPAINAITTEYSEREFSGSLFGLMLTAGSLGGAAGPLAFGWLAEATSIGVAFPAIAGVSLLGALVFLLLFRV